MSNKRMILSFLCVFLLIIIGRQISPPTLEEDHGLSVPEFDYELHAPISVTNDSELAAIANGGFGSADSPYIISGWNITGSPSHGIHIAGVTKYFRIENCWIVDSSDAGICVENASTGITSIIRNTCRNSGGTSGIYIRKSNSSTIKNNICTDNARGISLRESSFCTLTNNICNDNVYFGIILYLSNSSKITSNTCINNNDAINLISSSFATITDNRCFDNRGDGFSIDSSPSSILSNNTSNNNSKTGININFSDASTLSSNNCTNNSEYGISLFRSSSVILRSNFCGNNGERNYFFSNSDNVTTLFESETVSSWDPPLNSDAIIILICCLSWLWFIQRRQNSFKH
ncbi:MAG: right-handed parallel beta-helix repeat-containing protein [Candidatus Hodarchaeales archaeon]